MDRLQLAVERTFVDLRDVLRLLDDGGAKISSLYRSSLEMQLQSLQRMREETQLGEMGRRHWSFGLAAIPVVQSLLNAITTSPNSAGRQTVDACRASVRELRDALVARTEGR